MLAVFGLTKEDIPDEIVEVFADNWQAFLTFDSMSTQWRSSGMGATGLDYNVLPLVSKSVGLKKKDLPYILQDFRVLESEALKVMFEQRENKK